MPLAAADITKKKRSLTCAQVSHLGHVDQDHLDALVRPPDVSDARDVVRVADRRRRAPLRLPVALHDRHAEEAAEEHHDVRAQRRRARHHAPYAVEAQRPLDLVEEEPVPHRVGQPPLVESPRLGREGRPEHPLGEPALRRHARLDLVVDLVQHPRDHRDDRRAAGDDVLDEEERVAPVERHGRPVAYHLRHDDPFEYVRQWQIRDVPVGRQHLYVVEAAHGAHDVVVRDERPLRVAGGPRRVAEGGYVAGVGGAVGVSPGRDDLRPDRLDLGERDGRQAGSGRHRRGLGRHAVGQHDGAEPRTGARRLGLAQPRQLLPGADHAGHAGVLEDVPDRVRPERVVERHRRAAEAVDGLLGQDPLGAVPHVDPQEEEAVAVAVEEALAAGVEARGDRLDAGDALAVARVDVRRGEPAVAAVREITGGVSFVFCFLTQEMLSCSRLGILRRRAPPPSPGLAKGETGPASIDLFLTWWRGSPGTVPGG